MSVNGSMSGWVHSSIDSLIDEWCKCRGAHVCAEAHFHDLIRSQNTRTLVSSCEFLNVESGLVLLC